MAYSLHTQPLYTRGQFLRGVLHPLFIQQEYMALGMESLGYKHSLLLHHLNWREPISALYRRDELHPETTQCIQPLSVVTASLLYESFRPFSYGYHLNTHLQPLSI